MPFTMTVAQEMLLYVNIFQKRNLSEIVAVTDEKLGKIFKVYIQYENTYCAGINFCYTYYSRTLLHF